MNTTIRGKERNQIWIVLTSDGFRVSLVSGESSNFIWTRVTAVQIGTEDRKL